MKRVLMTILVFVMIISFSGCEMSDATESVTEATTETEDWVEYETELKDKADIILGNMTLDEKIYQMMFVTPESITGVGKVTLAGEKMKSALESMPVGGVILFSANIQNPEQVKALIEGMQEYSDTELFIGVDEEGGRVARLSGNSNMGLEKIPPMAKLETEEEAYAVGKKLGNNLEELGFNVDFAPVADVIVNEKNTEIGDRSFGTDSEKVGNMVAALVSGMEETRVHSVLKHFPGHGSTSVDSHTGYSASYRSIEELRECEFIPFKRGIDAGCGFVMVSHMSLVNATREKSASSLSKEVVTGMLREELGFEGIIITDSLSMGAIVNEYETGEAAVKAVEAGCDMLLMPKDVKRAVEAIKKAVEDGRISQSEIDERVRRILIAKNVGI